LFGQQTPTSFLKNLCSFESNKNETSKFVKIKLAVPCDWGADKNAGLNGVVKFFYEGKNIRATSSLVIGNLDNGITDKDANNLLTESGLKILTKGATYVSSKSIIVNGIKGGEVILKPNIEKPYCFYEIQNYFIYKRKIIMVDYSYTDKNKTNNAYSNYLKMFRNLVNKPQRFRE